jgi:hypothetical protein
MGRCLLVRFELVHMHDDIHLVDLRVGLDSGESFSWTAGKKVFYFLVGGNIIRAQLVYEGRSKSKRKHGGHKKLRQETG